jgi:hypothetical protein
VVDEDVVPIDLERDLGLADVRPADAEVHVGQRRRVGRVVLLGAHVVVLLADLQEHRRLDEAGVDRNPGDDDAGNVGDCKRDRAVHGGESGVPEPEDDRVSPLDRDALADVVDAGGKQQIHAAGELVVDRLHRVRRRGDEEVAQRDRASRGHAVGPSDPARVGVR